MTRGFFEIGIYHPKTKENIGTLWRSAYQLGAAGIFVIGPMFKKQRGDTVQAWRHIPMRTYAGWDDFNALRPHATPLVGIEIGGRPLSGGVVHPERAVYLLGAEDHGLPPAVQRECQILISIEAVRLPSFNVSVAGAIVMYHRMTQGVAAHAAQGRDTMRHMRKQVGPVEHHTDGVCGEPRTVGERALVS